MLKNLRNNKLPIASFVLMGLIFAGGLYQNSVQMKATAPTTPAQTTNAARSLPGPIEIDLTKQRVHKLYYEGRAVLYSRYRIGGGVQVHGFQLSNMFVNRTRTVMQANPVLSGAEQNDVRKLLSAQGMKGRVDFR